MNRDSKLIFEAYLRRNNLLNEYASNVLDPQTLNTFRGLAPAAAAAGGAAAAEAGVVGTVGAGLASVPVAGWAVLALAALGYGAYKVNQNKEEIADWLIKMYHRGDDKIIQQVKKEMESAKSMVAGMDAAANNMDLDSFEAEFNKCLGKMSETLPQQAELIRDAYNEFKRFLQSGVEDESGLQAVQQKFDVAIKSLQKELATSTRNLGDNPYLQNEYQDLTINIINQLSQLRNVVDTIQDIDIDEAVENAARKTPAKKTPAKTTTGKGGITINIDNSKKSSRSGGGSSGGGRRGGSGGGGGGGGGDNGGNKGGGGPKEPWSNFKRWTVGITVAVVAITEEIITHGLVSSSILAALKYTYKSTIGRATQNFSHSNWDYVRGENGSTQTAKTNPAPTPAPSPTPAPREVGSRLPSGPITGQQMKDYLTRRKSYESR